MDLDQRCPVGQSPSRREVLIRGGILIALRQHVNKSPPGDVATLKSALPRNTVHPPQKASEMKNQIAAILLSVILSMSTLPQAIIADEPPKTLKQQILGKWKLMFSEKGRKKTAFSDGQVAYMFANESVPIVGKVD